MFDVSWSELLILAIVTLIFVGPKELPVFLGTLGRYAGMVRKQATEFKRHFDDAMREAELDQIKKDVEAMTRDVNESVMSATRAAESEVNGVKAAMNPSLSDASTAPAPAAVAAPANDTAALAPPPVRAASDNV
jgi:sec-independent protein translocase protein TatB